MANKKISLFDVIDPKPNSVVMICDVHASESGALSILNDLYWQVRNDGDKSVRWIFIVSTPEYEQTENIIVRRFPWVKKNWGYRLFFDAVNMRKLIKEYDPDQIFSLQNKGVSFYKKRQQVYLHLAFILSEHRFRMKTDGKKLWIYQNVLSRIIFSSLKKADTVIVQTQWMKEALEKKAGIESKKIVVVPPDILNNSIGTYQDTPENRKRFFYPATAFRYKNHITLLKALTYAVKHGLKDYQVIFTIRPKENKYTRQLYSYVQKNNLRVLFNGSIPREKVFDLYTRSILVFPSYVETFGLPLLEARKSGTYILASDCSFSREILEEYEKALFFGETDYVQLGKYILSLNNGK